MLGLHLHLLQLNHLCLHTHPTKCFPDLELNLPKVFSNHLSSVCSSPSFSQRIFLSPYYHRHSSSFSREAPRPRTRASYSNVGMNSKSKFPSIKKITNEAFAAVLPCTGTGEQVLEELGDPSAWLRRSVLSLFGSMLLYDLSQLLTVVAAFYWVWCPMFSAARINAIMRFQYGYAGVWSGRVAESSVVEKDSESFIQLTICDESGFTIEMCAPLRTEKEKMIAKVNVISKGEAVKMLALSDKSTFERFIVLREAFFPKFSIWLHEQTYLEHSVFEDMVMELAALNNESLEDENGGGVEGSKTMNEESSRELESFEYEQYYKNRDRSKYVSNFDPAMDGFSPPDSAISYSDSFLDSSNAYDKSDFY